MKTRELRVWTGRLTFAKIELCGMFFEYLYPISDSEVNDWDILEIR